MDRQGVEELEANIPNVQQRIMPLNAEQDLNASF